MGSSEPEKNDKQDIAPGKATEEKPAISEKVADLKEKAEPVLQKSGDDSQKPKTSEAEKDVKLDTEPAQSAESHKQMSKEETDVKKEPVALPEQVVDKKHEKTDAAPPH